MRANREKERERERERDEGEQRDEGTVSAGRQRRQAVVGIRLAHRVVVGSLACCGGRSLHDLRASGTGGRKRTEAGGRGRA